MRTPLAALFAHITAAAIAQSEWDGQTGASGPELVLGYFRVTAEREDATLDQDGLQG